MVASCKQPKSQRNNKNSTGIQENKVRQVTREYLNNSFGEKERNVQNKRPTTLYRRSEPSKVPS